MASPQTFEDLSDEVYDLLTEFADSLNQEIDRIVGMLNDAAGSIGDFISHLNPFDDNTIEKAIDKWNNEISPKITEMWNQLQDNVWDAVGDLAGRPLQLLAYYKAFNEVKSTIYREGDLAQKMVIFQHDWTGYAADNYKVVATTEDTALMNLSLAFDAGGTLTSGAAKQILDLWTQLCSEFLGWTADLLGCFKTATDAGSILTFEVPTIFEAAKAIWQAIIDLGTILTKFLVEQATSGVNSWQQLAAGARGLPGNTWPMVEEGNSDVMNDPGNWRPQSA